MAKKARRAWAFVFAFVVVTLAGSTVLKPAQPETAGAKAVLAGSHTTVVLIVLDEFPTVSLMGRGGRIDAARFPNFAALARDSTWFRNATSAHPHTVLSVPAILDGRLAKPGLRPTFADHPSNLFAILGGAGYRVKAVESLAHLCPPNVCGGKARMMSSRAGERGGSPAQTFPACGRNICRFASLITTARRPTLYFIHALLPHVPWLYLPSGRRYAGDVRVLPGAETGTWRNDRWLAKQAKQRHLLQLGYADRALGIVMRRLHATGVYDRSLAVVSGDHGLSFRPGQPRRNLTPANLADIAFVPLFVKLPGQTHGRVDNSLAQTIDILPTIAAALRVRLTGPVDGRSLLGRRPAANGTISLLASNGRPVRADLRTLVARRRQALAEQIAVFGTGSLERVYQIGPHRELIGRRVGTLRVRRHRGESVEVSGREFLGAVDLSLDILPTYITGELTGRHRPQQDLAVAVNGKIAAVTRSYTKLSQTRFAALVPEQTLRKGANRVSLYGVAGTTRRPVLEVLRSANRTYSLRAATLHASDGRTIPLRNTIAGEVGCTESSSGATVGGWAANLRARRAAASIVVFVNGRSVFVGENGNTAREDIVDHYDVQEAGFIFRLPASLLPAAHRGHDVRVVGITGNVASELRYLPGYPWARR